LNFETIRTGLAGARSLVILTGAGISAESGVPIFRGPGGLWREHRPEDLATPEAFEANPRLIWEWYQWRRQKIAQARPNPGHEALVTLEQRSADFTLITQNVDGLHSLAGSRNVLEVHGNLWRTRCLSCHEIRENRDPDIALLPPRCACEGMLRPDVVWFGERLPPEMLERSVRAVDACEFMLVIGTSGVVQPAASWALAALERGATVVEVNPEPTPLSALATHHLRGKAAELLPRLVA
jgi:NAD-dependent deacetylase